MAFRVRNPLTDNGLWEKCGRGLLKDSPPGTKPVPDAASGPIDLANLIPWFAHCVAKDCCGR
jgi:hypothetical protein